MFCLLLLGRAELGVDERKMGKGTESHTQVTHSGSILHLPHPDMQRVIQPTAADPSVPRLEVQKGGAVMGPRGPLV